MVFNPERSDGLKTLNLDRKQTRKIKITAKTVYKKLYIYISFCIIDNLWDNKSLIWTLVIKKRFIPELMRILGNDRGGKFSQN